MLGTVLSVGSLALNAFQQAQNYASQQEAYNYQQWLNQKQMEREDNAYQRAVSDMRKAGLSPLGAVAASAGSMSTAEAPQYDSNSSVGAFGNAVQSMQIAEQRRMNDSAIGLNSSIEAKNYADFQGKLVDNVYKASEHITALNKQKQEIENLRTENKINEVEAKKREALLDKRIEDLQKNIEKMQQSIDLTNERAEYNRVLGIPVDTSWSASQTTPIGYGQTTAKNLSEQGVREEHEKTRQSNAQAQAEDFYKQELAMRESRLAELKKQADKTKGISDRNAYYIAEKSLKEFKKNKKQYIQSVKQNILSGNYAD